MRNAFSFLKAKRIYWGMTFVLIVALLSLLVVDYMDELELAAIPNQPTTAPSGSIQLTVNVASRVLQVYNDGAIYKVYRIAVGKRETPTPVGEWNVVWKDYDWGTGFGTRWMGLNVPWGTYGIHGTNKPWSIGAFASHGCIRMRNKDVEELFEWVPVGTTVKIEGAKIKLNRALRYTMSGPDVVLLQMKLRELGYFSGRADGIFGQNTENAVKQFQSSKSFEATGVVNKVIYEALGISSEI